MEINFLAVVVAAIANMILGAIWYSPAVAGTQWMKLIGLTKADMEKAKPQMGKLYALGFLGSLVMSFVLAHLLDLVAAMDMSDAWQLAFWVWLGFVATTQLNRVTWGGKPKELWVLDNVYYLATLGVMSTILILWI